LYLSTKSYNFSNNKENRLVALIYIRTKEIVSDRLFTGQYITGMGYENIYHIKLTGIKV